MTDGEISKIVENVCDMRPYFIEERFKLRTPIYSETAAYGHFGRPSEEKEISFEDTTGNVVKCNVVTFPWERLDYVEKVKSAFNL